MCMEESYLLAIATYRMSKDLGNLWRQMLVDKGSQGLAQGCSRYPQVCNDMVEFHSSASESTRQILCAFQFPGSYQMVKSPPAEIRVQDLLDIHNSTHIP